MVYVKALKRYILLTWSWHKDFEPSMGAALYMYEATEPWGPFNLFHYEQCWEDGMWDWKVTPYCPRLPLKWMSKDGKSGWLQFSGDCRSNNHYLSHIRPFKLIIKH